MQSQQPTDDQMALQLEQQRQLAAAQWQAQQVQLAQLAALTDQRATTPVAQPELSAAAAPATDIVERLQKLAALRDQGILTEDEFAAQKARILEQG